MREIKFKVWVKPENKMFEGIIDIETILFETFSKWEKEELELLQYTGLKDKNGAEIYEGDIVYVAGYGKYEVKFPFIELYEANNEKDIGDILGNIYQNYEFIK